MTPLDCANSRHEGTFFVAFSFFRSAWNALMSAESKDGTTLFRFLVDPVRRREDVFLRICLRFVQEYSLVRTEFQRVLLDIEDMYLISLSI
jgi:hypothetical protein